MNRVEMDVPHQLLTFHRHQRQPRIPLLPQLIHQIRLGVISKHSRMNLADSIKVSSGFAANGDAHD